MEVVTSIYRLNIASSWAIPLIAMKQFALRMKKAKNLGNNSDALGATCG